MICQNFCNSLSCGIHVHYCARGRCGKTTAAGNGGEDLQQAPDRRTQVKKRRGARTPGITFKIFNIPTNSMTFSNIFAIIES